MVAELGLKPRCSGTAAHTLNQKICQFEKVLFLGPWDPWLRQSVTCSLSMLAYRHYTLLPPLKHIIIFNVALPIMYLILMTIFYRKCMFDNFLWVRKKCVPKSCKEKSHAWNLGTYISTFWAPLTTPYKWYSSASNSAPWNRMIKVIMITLIFFLSAILIHCAPNFAEPVSLNI